LLEGLILLHAGDFSDAKKAFAYFTAWGAPSARSRPSLLTVEYLGDLHLEQGQADEASRYYEEVWPKAMALVPKGDIVAELRRRRAEVHYLKQDYEKAYEEATGGLEHCRELGDRYEEAATYRILALSAAALGRPDEARKWFDQGFAYYDDIETPYEWGKLWMAYGDWLRGPNAGGFADQRAALEAYHAARDHFERMGAKAKLAETNARIADMATAVSGADLVRQNASIEPAVNEAASHRRHARRRPRTSSDVDRLSEWAWTTFRLITRDKSTLHTLENVAKLALSRSPILVLGESGTGKELVAHGIHHLSGRKGAFVAINCSALPRDMIESELFGHVAGSFTGASRDKAGLFEVCDGGTIFLDEIAEMSVELQSRLLRLLETGESRRVGSTRNVAVDTRVVAATNRPRHGLESGEGFRPDLYYRLAHAVITLPPLRRRGGDLDLLIERFLDEACAEEGRTVTLSSAARKRMRAHAWPGNIRQLRAAIRRMVLLAANGDEIPESMLELDAGTAPATLFEELEETERQKIAEALAASRGSRTEAARSLGIPRTTFINKMKRYGLK
jgi:two-component system NtrC family response regulator